MVNQNHNRRARTHFDPIHMTYSQLFRPLIQKGLIVTRSLPTILEPYPLGYDPNAYWEFHEGAPGHSLEGCYAFKAKVQELINSKILSFKDVGPNVRSNPLPRHENWSMKQASGSTPRASGSEKEAHPQHDKNLFVSSFYLHVGCLFALKHCCFLLNCNINEMIMHFLNQPCCIHSFFKKYISPITLIFIKLLF